MRRAQRLTQERLAERAGVSYKFLGEVERGAGNPTIDWLEAIAAALEVRVRDLISDEELKPVTYRPLSAPDYAVVREARDSLEEVLKQVDRLKRSKRRPRH